MKEEKTHEERVEELLVGIYNNTYSTKVNLQVVLYGTLIAAGIMAFLATGLVTLN